MIGTMLMEPGGRQPAPGDLRVVQAFVNTTNLEDETDELDSPEGLADWLVREGLLPQCLRVSEEELRVALELREALRALLRANNGEELDPCAPETLNRVAQGVPLIVGFTTDGSPHLKPAEEGVRGAMGRILGVVLRAAAEGSWARLKACKEDVCQWAFYDRSRNHSGRWCAMSICGTRAKMRVYRGGGRRSGRKDEA